jgi:hypothetical protein
VSSLVKDELKCGECGKDTFKLYTIANENAGRLGGGPRFEGEIRVKCVTCGEVSKITSARPAIETEGTLCGGWGK